MEENKYNFEDKIVTLRSVYGKMKEYHFQPTKQPNGSNWDWVKKVKYDSAGNAEMIYSPKDLEDPNYASFLPEDADIVVTDGTTFDLSKPIQYFTWMSIKDSDLIAPSRDTRDSRGDLLIDGNKKRYGTAELYVDVPGEESERSVNRKQKITKAWTFVGSDSKNGRLTKCKLLGKDMSHAYDSDVEDYLYQRAEKNPDEIIDLYTSGDLAIRLLIIEAREKNVIYKKDGMYFYADTILGATDEAIALYFKMPTSKRIFDAIKFATYPEYAPLNKESVIEDIVEPTAATPKKTASKK